MDGEDGSGTLRLLIDYSSSSWWDGERVLCAKKGLFSFSHLVLLASFFFPPLLLARDYYDKQLDWYYRAPKKQLLTAHCSGLRFTE